jgi:hypothetical protein
MGHAIAVHDVLGIDARPHHDAQLGELRAHFAELFRQRTLRGIELGRTVEQRRALGVVGSELSRTMGDAAIPRRILDVRHSVLPLDQCVDRGKRPEKRRPKAVAPLEARPSRRPHANDAV